MKLRRVIFTNSSTVRVLSMTRFVVDKLASLVLVPLASNPWTGCVQYRPCLLEQTLPQSSNNFARTLYEPCYQCR